MSDSTETANLTTALGVIQNDLHDMKSSMSKMAEAISKIAILEERHQAMHNTMLRALDKLEEQQGELNNLKLEQVRQSTSIKVSIKAIQVAWAVLGSGILAGVWFGIKAVAVAG